jgi:PAS domain S-box-containing protein
MAKRGAGKGTDKQRAFPLEGQKGAALEKELSKFRVLYDLAIAMTAERGMDENLQLVVEKSRELLGADTAYIALRDEARGDVFMHTLSGIRTEAFRNMRLPFGKGLGGLVAKTRQGYVVEDYFAEKTIEHVVDQVVADEGVVSGMAVPVQMGSKNLGVLYVFNRRKTRFSQSDLDTLFLIGNLAAVEITRESTEEALQNARDELEALVAERTRELIRKNEELEQKIEDHRRMGQALRESEEKYRTILESIEEGYFEVDLGGHFTFYNTSLCEKLGYSPGELANMSYKDVAAGNSAGKIYDVLNEISRTGKPAGMVEYEIIRKDGTRRVHQLSASLMRDGSGTPVGFRGFSRDITETIELREQLEHAQKLESIGTIAGGVAHNFRNILSGILINNQLLQLKFKDNQTLMRITGKISEETRKGAQLVSGLMEFARKPGAKEFKILNLSEVLRETYDLISKSFDKKIQIEIDVPEFLPLMGDRSGLSQVFINLCTNARDAMPEGGRLLITAETEGEQARIVFSDTGQGMDEESRLKCFDPFFTTKMAGEGTGLGLSTSYGIIKEHKGDIRVQSGSRRGASFQITLPLASMEELERRVSVPELIRGRGQKILVVDDETSTLEPMEDLLESMGYRVYSVSNGKDALEKYDAWNPDAVLMDRNMPKMDGITCTRHILEKHPAARIILMSGYDAKGPDGIDDKIRGSIVGYITKPPDMVALSRMLNGLFSEEDLRL